MLRKILIAGVVIILLGGVITWFIIQAKPSGVELLVLKSPSHIVIKGDSAKYVGRAQYEIFTTVINNTGKPLVYMPVFGLIKDSVGKKIGMAMGNTGRLLRPGEQMQVVMDTDIPKELGTPKKIELYSE